MVTDSGFETAFESLTRRKGRSKPLDTTGLFEGSGDVCYFNAELCDPFEECSQTEICCTNEDGDGVYESREAPANGMCVSGTATDAFCKSYTAEWVFSIAEFVRYPWDAENSGLKVLQVRLYPNP